MITSRVSSSKENLESQGIHADLEKSGTFASKTLAQELQLKPKAFFKTRKSLQKNHGVGTNFRGEEGCKS